MRYIVVLLLLMFSYRLESQIYKIESDDLYLIYVGKNLSYISPYSIKAHTNAIDFHKEFWDWKPSEDITILLNDFEDDGNGGTMVMPRNYIVLYVAPFTYDFDMIPSNERMQWLMSHELAHVVTNDKAARSDKFWRALFSGKVIQNKDNPLSMIYSYLTAPRWYSPRWYQEGIAVFMETWMSGGLGRSIGSYDEMVFRTMVRDSAYFYHVIGLETEGTTIDFQVGVNAYLYGTRFIDYIAYKYGVENLKKLYVRNDSSKKFYASQFKKIYGISVVEAWSDWIKFEHEFQMKNLERIQEYDLTELDYITDKALGTVSKPYYDKKNQKIYCAINHPGKLARIVEIDINTGEIEKIDDVLSPKLRNVTQLGADIENNILFASTHNSNMRGLKSINIETKEDKKLQEFSRTGYLTINPADKSLWGIQTFSGRTAIVKSEPPYDKFMRLYSIPYGISLFYLDISPDGKYLSSTWSNPEGKQKLVAFDIDSLINGNTNYRELYEFEDNSAANFRFSDDGKYLYGTSYYTGVSNVFRIEFETGKMQALSNTDRGLFRPLHIGGDSLLVWEYTTTGLRPAIMKINPIEDINAIEYLGQKVVDENPILKDWRLPSPAKINIESDLETEGDYNSFANIKVASIYPIVEGFKDFPAYGLRFNFMDLVGINSFSINASYSPNPLLPEKQRLHLFLDYNYWQWNIKAGWNKADFYDLFGPTKVSRAGYMLSASRITYLIMHKKPKIFNLTTTAAVYGDLETLPGYQNVDMQINQLFYGNAELHYSLLRKSLGSIEDEAGIDTKLMFDASYANEDVFPRIMANINYGILGPTKNSSIWLRSSAGIGFADRDNPLSNFYFGGFGNNYVDKKPTHQYRLAESFPGLEINQVPANNYAKIMLEYNLTPLRFKNFGLLYLFLTHTNLSLFASTLVSDIHDEVFSRNIYNCGAQLDFEIVFFSLLKTTLSLGYGVAFEEGFYPREDFLISLKLM